MYTKPQQMRLGRKDIIYVGIQFLFFGAYILNIRFWEFQIPSYLETAFLVLACFGIGIVLLSFIQLNTSLSPFPTPRKGSQLVNTGLYKLVRHPIYTGIFLTLFGYGTYSASAYRIIISLILLVIFCFKSNYEEERLVEIFPDYREYQKSTGRFLPKFKF